MAACTIMCIAYYMSFPMVVLLSINPESNFNEVSDLALHGRCRLTFGVILMGWTLVTQLQIVNSRGMTPILDIYNIMLPLFESRYVVPKICTF
jgi:hypothetical protein